MANIPPLTRRSNGFILCSTDGCDNPAETQWTVTLDAPTLAAMVAAKDERAPEVAVGDTLPVFGCPNHPQP